MQQRDRIDLTGHDYTAIYALSDIHGCYQAMMRAQKRIVEDASTFAGRKLLMFLGDYVDRGLDSAGVIDRLTWLRKELGIDGIVAELNPGGLIALELERRSLQLLTHEVMPAFK